MCSGEDHLRIDTGERMGALATTKASTRYKAEGAEATELGARYTVDLAEAVAAKGAPDGGDTGQVTSVTMGLETPCPPS